MTDVVIIKLQRFNYISKYTSVPNSSTFLNIKSHIFNNFKHFINQNDIILWIYAGKIITNNTDLTTITHPICCYILTDIISSSNNSPLFSNIFSSIINNISNMDEFIYREQMNQMLDMGFSNEEYIRDSLILCEGRIVDAITMYMSF